MAHRFLDLAFTPSVLAAQQHYYGRAQALPTAVQDDPLGPDEIAFIESRDSFYLSSISEAGWPYMQHRGGPSGFVKVVSSNELAFADYKGNRQMLTTGNAISNDRVCLFMMDYPRRERLKLLGHLEVLDAREHPDLVQQLTTPELAKITERLFRIRLVSFDWNCPKYITPRFTAAEINEAIAPLKQRIAELEAQLPPQEPMNLLTKCRGDSAALPPRAANKAVALAFVGGFLAIAVIALLAQSLHVALVLGSFGASCVLVFGFPDVPFSQPRNVVLGHLLSTLVGLAFVHLCGPHWWSVALAVGSAIALMMLTRTVHPPAGSNPVIVFLMQPGWGFALFPTLVGAVLLVLVALVFHNVTRAARWPKYW